MPRPLPFLVALLAVSTASFAQSESPAPPADTQRSTWALEREAFRAFDRRDYPAAEAALRKQIELDPVNFVPHYNLACALALQDRVPDAMESLICAVERGFVDYRTLTSDAQLAALRPEPKYRALIDHWSEVLERHRDANLATAESIFRGRNYETTFDEPHRLAWYSGFDPGSTEIAKRELERVMAWAGSEVFPDIFDPEAMKSDPWVIVALPDRPDYNRWLDREYGPGARTETRTIGGAYSHDQKRLVAMDLGATLRHEFLHVLHWRDNTRKGQVHAEWVQEGLCSLVEDYDLGGRAGLTPVPSWRTNIVLNLAETGDVPELADFLDMRRGRMTASRPLANYAIARTLFLYLSQTGKLREWYANYCDTFSEDPRGGAAWEKTFGKPLGDIDADFHAWLRKLPRVPEEVADGQASLGLEINFGGGDGIVVSRFLPNSPARAAGLRTGDVLTGINGRPTADFYEFVRVITSYKPGDAVEVTYRRGRLHGNTRVTLIGR